MKKTVLILLSLLLLNGCAKNITSVDLDLSGEAKKVLAVAEKINNVTGKLMKGVGPLAVAGICTVQPQDCPAAQTAYTLAVQAQALYAKAIDDCQAANEAPDGLKLATLAQNFQSRYQELSKILGTGSSVDLSEFESKLSELQAVNASTPAK